MSQLTAGIEILIDAWGEAILVGMEEEASSCSVAIMILKAAEGVDKERALRVLATLLKFYVENTGGAPYPARQIIPKLEVALEAGAVIEIRALIESLPDEKEPGKKEIPE